MKIFRRAIAAATSSIMAASMCIINVSDISNIGGLVYFTSVRGRSQERRISF